MSDTPTFALLDIALRAAALALLAMLGLLALRGRVRQPLGRMTAALAAGLGLQLLAAAPVFADRVPAALQVALAAVSVANAVVFWLFARALVDARFALRRADGLAWAAVAGASLLHCALALRGGGPAATAAGWALGLLPLAFGGMALKALVTRRGALDDGVRGLGVLVIGGGFAYALGQQLLRLGARGGRLDGPQAATDAAALLALLALVAWRALRLDAGGPWGMTPVPVAVGASARRTEVFGSAGVSTPASWVSAGGALAVPRWAMSLRGRFDATAPRPLRGGARPPDVALIAFDVPASSKVRREASGSVLRGQAAIGRAALARASAPAQAHAPAHAPEVVDKRAPDRRHTSAITTPPVDDAAPAGPPRRDDDTLAALVDTPSAAIHDPADDRLLAALEHLMATRQAYRDEGLGIAALAQRLDAPEYRLRRVINRRLGHRNFNAYLNGLRLADARAALADPARRGLPVLTIALSAGFQSIGPFNRAFKAETGLTPTEFRRQKLAES